MADVLLQTKLYRPTRSLAQRPFLVTRSHLSHKLNAGVSGKLALVSAPAGFGKTTLVAAWLEELAEAQTGIGWLSLDENDNDLVRFLAYLVAALQTAVSGIGETAVHLLQSPQPSPAETILTLLINDISQNDQPLILVLDDYHTITTLAIHQALAFLLDHLPPQLHLLLITRSDPPLPLSRLRARGQMVEIRTNDLRFSLDEVQQFFNQGMGLTLSDEEVAALEQRTEGWIAGLQLAGLSMQGRDDLPDFVAAFTGSHRFIIDYLTDEVLERRPKGTKNFLLQTSILDRLCGPLCDAVTGQSDSQAILEQLEQANLFLIPLDEERHWYRYHHLFADLLGARLRQSQPKLLPDLHRRAIEWYEANYLMAEAIQHALSAGDMARAAGLIERERWALLGRGEINTLHTWLEELPVETIRARPRLSLAYAWILSLLEQAEAIEACLQDAEEALAVAVAETPEQTAEAGAIQGEIATLRAETALSQSDIPGAIEFCRHGLKLLPQDDTLMRGVTTYFLGHAQRRNGQMAEAEEAYVKASNLGLRVDNLLLALHALSNLSNVQMALGCLGEAAESSQRILQITAQRQRQAWPVAGLAYQGLGRLHYEWNELDAAERYLRLGIEFGQRGGLIGLEINSRSALAFTLQAQHDPDGADEMLRQIAMMTERHHHPVYAAIAAATEARLRLSQGRTAEAAHWAETCGLHLDDNAWPYHLETGYMTLARVFIAQGQAEAVLDLLHRLQQVAESDQRTGSLIEILILCALARQAQGDLTNALAVLEQALGLAEQEGFVRHFVDEGKPMAALLRQARLHGLHQTYVDKLLAVFSTDEAAPRTADLLPEPLSERELDVLQLVAAGASNQDIADQLFIALSTVKKHMSNILVKLDTPNRVQASARARELGLLS